MLATVVEVEGGVTVEPGAKCLVRDGKVRGETIGDAARRRGDRRESASRLRAEKSQLVSLDIPRGGRQAGSLFRSDAVAAETDCGWRRSYRGAAG